MLSGLRQKTVVQPGGLVEIQSPELPAGTAVEVIVLLEPTAEAPKTLTSLIGQAKGSFATPEEVDRFIRQEREGWNS